MNLILNPLFILFFVLFFSFSTSAQKEQLSSLSYYQLDTLIEIEDINGDYRKVISYVQTAKTKAEEEFGKNDSTYASYTTSLGYYYMEVGQYGRAEKLYLEALKIQSELLGKMSLSYAETVNHLATLYQYMGNFERALPLFKEVVAIAGETSGLESELYAVFLNNLSVLYENMGSFEQALPLALKGKQITAKIFGTNHFNYAIALSNIANLYCYMGQFDLALPLYIENKNILHKVIGEQNPSYAMALMNIGLVYKDLKQYKEALPLYEEATKIEAKVLGLNHPEYALSLSNYGTLHLAMNNSELAIPLYKKAIDIYANSLGKGHLHYANSVSNLVRAYMEIKEYKLALPLALQTVEIGLSYGKDFLYSSLFLGQLSSVYYNIGQSDLALNTIKEALSISCGFDISTNISKAWQDSILNTSFPSVLHLTITIDNLEILYNLYKDTPKKQLLIADLVSGLLVRIKNSHSSTGDKLRILSQSSNWMLKSLKNLDKKEQINKAFELAEQNKSVLLLDASNTKNAYQFGDLPQSLEEQEKEFIKKRDNIQAKLLEKNSEEKKMQLNSSLNEVNQEFQNFIKKIEVDYPKYTALKYKNIEANVSDIQGLLDDKTALIEYVIGNNEVHIFYIDKTNIKWVSEPIQSSELSKKITLLHHVLSDYQLLSKKTNESYRLYTEQAHWFYNKLVAPALKEKSNKITHLIIIPDGELGHLPFETFLVNPASQAQSSYSKLHYLINDFSISYNYSATLWKQNKEAKKPVNNSQILAIAANYNLKLDSSELHLRLPTYQSLRNILTPLPSAREEVEVLAKKYNGLFLFDELASEKLFKEKAGDYAVIHLAMHGTLDENHPILSSLAFSEDKDSLENNFLQAYEISKMKLNADLVILSACETGFGKFEKGNGITSLAMSFMYAGASSLMVSLWQVNDFATSEMMELFYKNLAQGMSKDEALRQAKLEFIKAAGNMASHPAFWSPFILIGDESPVYLAPKGANNWWWLGLGVLGLGATALFLRSIKKK